MNFYTLIRLIKKNLIWLLGLPLIATVTAYVLTLNMPVLYESSTTLYTAIGTGYTIKSAERQSVDYQAVYATFENIISTFKSRETLNQTGKRLLAQHLMLKQPAPNVLGHEGFEQLRQTVNDSLRKLIVVPGNETATFVRLDSYLKENSTDNALAYLLRANTIYSAKYIGSNLTVKRSEMSDMINLTYKSADPGVTQQTLNLVVEAFRNRYLDLKTREARAVVQYYENKMNEASAKLQATEKRLQGFATSNELVDYDDQSRSLAGIRNQVESGYHQELMQSRAAKASLDALERRLGNRTNFFNANEDLQAKRAELSRVQGRLANAAILGQSPSVVNELQSTASRLTQELEATALKYYNASNTTEALPSQSLLSEWLNKVLQYEESTARLAAYESQLKDFNGRYQRIIPLGTDQGRLRRELQIAEKEYMAVLDGLNEARLQQKHLELSGPVSVLDAPDSPTIQANKARLIMIIGAFLVALFIVLAIIAIRELLNKRIQEPERAEKVTGFELAAAFPNINGRYTNRLKYVKHSMIEQLRSAINIELSHLPSRSQPHIIILFSTRPAQGKTWIGTALSSQFAAAGHRIAYLYPSNSAFISDEASNPQALSLVRAIEYHAKADFVDTVRVETLVDDSDELLLNKTDFIFLELPSLLETAIPAYLVSQSSLSILVVDAQSVWTKTDQNMSHLYQKATQRGTFQSRTLCVLNRVDLGFIDTIPEAASTTANQTLPQPATVAIAKPV